MAFASRRRITRTTSVSSTVETEDAPIEEVTIVLDLTKEYAPAPVVVPEEPIPPAQPEEPPMEPVPTLTAIGDGRVEGGAVYMSPSTNSGAIFTVDIVEPLYFEFTSNSNGSYMIGVVTGDPSVGWAAEHTTAGVVWSMTGAAFGSASGQTVPFGQAGTYGIAIDPTNKMFWIRSRNGWAIDPHMGVEGIEYNGETPPRLVIYSPGAGPKAPSIVLRGINGIANKYPTPVGFSTI